MSRKITAKLRAAINKHRKAQEAAQETLHARNANPAYPISPNERRIHDIKTPQAPKPTHGEY